MNRIKTIVRYAAAGAAAMALLAAVFWGLVLLEDLQWRYHEMATYHDAAGDHRHGEQGLGLAVVTAIYFHLIAVLFLIHKWISGLDVIDRVLLKRSVLFSAVLESVILLLGMLAGHALGGGSAGMTIFTASHYPVSFILGMGTELLSLSAMPLLYSFLAVAVQFILFVIIFYWLLSMIVWFKVRLRLSAG